MDLGFVRHKLTGGGDAGFLKNYAERLSRTGIAETANSIHTENTVIKGSHRTSARKSIGYAAIRIVTGPPAALAIINTKNLKRFE